MNCYFILNWALHVINFQKLQNFYVVQQTDLKRSIYFRKSIEFTEIQAELRFKQFNNHLNSWTVNKHLILYSAVQIFFRSLSTYLITLLNFWKHSIHKFIKIHFNRNILRKKSFYVIKIALASAICQLWLNNCIINLKKVFLPSTFKGSHSSLELIYYKSTSDFQIKLFAYWSTGKNVRACFR